MHIFFTKLIIIFLKKRIDKKYGIDVEIKDGGADVKTKKKEKKITYKIRGFFLHKEKINNVCSH
jgi:hypothetical protein